MKEISNEDFFSEDNVPESNWMKFEKVGDAVRGTLIEVGDKPATDQFAAQKVYTLLLKDGDTMNVGISVKKDFIIQKMKKAVVGQLVGFKLTEIIPATTKGFNPTKSITPYVITDKSTGQPILDDEWMKTQDLGEDSIADEVAPFKG